LVELAQPLLNHGSPERTAMLHGYSRLRATLGEPGVTTRASQAIFDQVM
jgi:lipid-A-disaccharide synthase